ncbi:MAG TPA: hypothetical protein VIL49_01610 [Capillimicrobium sp.]
MTDTGTRGDPAASGGKLDDAKQQAAEQAQQVAGQAREQAQQAKEQVTQRASGMVDQRTTQAGEQISTQVEDIRTVAQNLREQGKEGPAKLAEQAADRAERVSSYLTDSDGDRILSDVERIARQNPWAVIAGGVVVGFAASRFLKASSQKRFESSSDFERYRAPQIPRTTTPATSGVGVGTAGRDLTDTAPPTTPVPADTAGVGTGAPSTASPVGSL